MEGQKAGEENVDVPLIETAGAAAANDQASEICRLQFRFPDGSSTSREFHAKEILEDVVAFVAQVQLYW